MATDLIMLGGVHRDPQGGQRLERALAGLELSLISVEVSPYALAWRRRRGPELLRRLEENLPRAAQAAGLKLEQALEHASLAWLRAYLEPPWEWTASQRLAQARGIPCIALDLSGLSRQLLAEAPQMVEVENLLHLLSGPAPAGAEMERRRAQALLAGRGGWPRPEPLEPGREAALARRLGRVLASAARLGWSRVAHLGGWQHLLAGQNPPGLADRLGVPLVRRRLL